MFLSKIQVKNLRNFHSTDVSLGSTSVVVGENSVGKSNLLFALRLVLDSKLPDSSRQLREEDFWEGLTEPVRNGDTIEVSVEFQDFVANKKIFAVLQPYCVQGSGTGTARLTYRFRPKSPLPDNRRLTIDDYEFLVFGGLSEKTKIDFYTRKWIAMEVLPALRDAERDLATWRQSPLRPLLESLSIADSTLKGVAATIDQATSQLLADNDVQQLIQRIESRLSAMVGSGFSIAPSLGFTPTIPDRLARQLRLFGDGPSQRSIGELSLGANNVLYLLLLAIELERKETSSERAVTILAIEEPEAHLHPHLQRLVFRDFLRRESPILLTTHSPHIASVAPLNSVVLLRHDPSGDGSKATSTLGAGLSLQESADLERYLDATRAELLFARGVILVEGAAELFLVPAAAECMGKSLDEYGITVCSVHGTDFVPYAKLLGPGGLNIPFVVLTDGDWYRTGAGERRSRGMHRAVAIASALGHPECQGLHSALELSQWEEAHKIANGMGIFIGQQTLEVDFFNSGQGSAIVETLDELGASRSSISRLQELVAQTVELGDDDAGSFLKALERIGKGRVAQRLAGRIGCGRIPTYFTKGINNITVAVAK